jgi:ankyrin repeat protein
MKSCLCISVPTSRDERTARCRDSSDTHEDDTRTGEMGHSKGGISTLIEVFRCELGRPGQSSITGNGLGPTKGWTPLYYAVYHNREAALLHFLQAGHSPDGVADIGQPPLCIAVTAGHIGIVRILLAAGVDINATTKHDCENPLHLAIKHGRSDLVDVLLSHGPELDAQTLSTHETPLHYAAARPGSLAIVVTLLKNGANYESLNAKGSSPAEVALQTQNLHAAVAIISAARGQREKLAKEKELLLKHVEKAQNRFSTNNELIADIFEAGCPTDSTVLVEAIKRDDVGLVKMFLEKGADPNRATGNAVYPIFTALNCSSARVVHALLEHGADVTLRDRNGLTVLQVALDCPLTQDKVAIAAIIDALLLNGADPLARYADGTTLLHLAVGPGLGLARVGQQLLKYGVKIDELDNAGNTALHAAIHSRSCVAMLLKHGANAHMVNHRGDTVLLHALRTSNRQQEPDLEQLIKVSRPRTTDSGGNTALHLAAGKGLEKSVRLLLQAGADTTSTAGQDRTPLHLAVLSHQWHVIPHLAIQPGINSWDEEGTTALHHIATSVPKTSDTWKDIALAAAPFCEKGVSRIMRDRSGATPLIQAVKTLPEKGLPVVEMLLSEKASRGSNCIGHEDLQGLDALFYAATLGKPAFVDVLLRYGAPYTLRTWKPSKGPLQPTNDINSQILKLFAEHEWLRRAAILQRQSAGAQSDPILPNTLPVRDLTDLLAMGLDPNALPRAKPKGSLLWVVLNQAGLPQPPPVRYLHDALQVVLSAGADPNVIANRSLRRTSPGRNSPQPTSALHPLAFLLEQCPDVDIELVGLFLDKGAELSISSPFYDGRYPLHSAVQMKRLDVVDLFLQRKVDVNSFDTKGCTPVFEPAAKGCWEMFNLLVNSGAKVDIKDSDGNTTLHAAAVGGNSRIISALLQAGVKACEKNHKGLVPSDCVGDGLEEKDKDKITTLLKHAEEQERHATLLKENQSQRRVTQDREEREQTPTEAKQQSHNPPRTIISPPQSSSRIATSSTTKPPVSVERSANAPLHLSKQMVSIHYSPPLPPQQHAKSNAQEPADLNGNSLLPPQPRTDSGLDVEQPSGVNKPLPLLNREKTAFDSSDNEKNGKGEELADWLAISRMLEGL